MLEPRHQRWPEDGVVPDEEAATVAGLVLHESRIIPEPGQIFTFFGFRFEILGRSGNRLTTLGVTPPDENQSVS